MVAARLLLLMLPRLLFRPRLLLLRHAMCLQGVWSRALGLPIERPKSVSSRRLEEMFGEVKVGWIQDAARHGDGFMKGYSVDMIGGWNQE
jgi:hypothetical protein